MSQKIINLNILRFLSFLLLFSAFVSLGQWVILLSYKPPLAMIAISFGSAFLLLITAAGLWLFKKWGWLLGLFFILFMIATAVFGMIDLKNPKGRTGQMTFHGYVQGYLDRIQIDQGSSPLLNPQATTQARVEELTRLQETFEKNAWPQAKKKMAMIYSGLLAIYVLILIFLLVPGTRSLFYQNAATDLPITKSSNLLIPVLIAMVLAGLFVYFSAAQQRKNSPASDQAPNLSPLELTEEKMRAFAKVQILTQQIYNEMLPAMEEAQKKDNQFKAALTDQIQDRMDAVLVKEGLTQIEYRQISELSQQNKALYEKLKGYMQEALGEVNKAKKPAA